MNKRLFTLLATASFLSVVKPAFAAPAAMGNTDQELQKVSAQTAVLESEVNSLKQEIHQLKAEQGHLQKTTRSLRTIARHEPLDTLKRLHVPPSSPEESTQSPFKHSPVTYLSGTPVVIAPYIGQHNAFNALDLVVNYSSYNLDLNLLKLRQQMDKQYTDACLPVPNSPMLMLSGKIEGQGIYMKPYAGGHTSKIDLSSAELDVIPTIGPWASGYAAFTYDNSATPNTPLVANSRAFVKRAFMTFGNLNRFPLYMTVGQFDVPFSDYGSYMISDILPASIFRTRARALLFGYEGASGQGPYAQVFAFNGDSNTSHNNNINNVGANAGFNFTHGIYSGDLGLSGIANVADSLGMQSTGAPSGFPGFSVSKPSGASSELLKQQVPGAAIHANFGIGPFGGMARYVKATSAFATQDMMFNGRGARPQAMDAELYYNFHVFNKPTVFSVAYDKSWEALALGVPEQRYIATLMTSIWRSTIEQIEFRHDVNYGMGDTASGASIVTPATAKGGVSNTVTAQIGIYF